MSCNSCSSDLLELKQTNKHTQTNQQTNKHTINSLCFCHNTVAHLMLIIHVSMSATHSLPSDGSTWYRSFNTAYMIFIYNYIYIYIYYLKEKTSTTFVYLLWAGLYLR